MAMHLRLKRKQTTIFLNCEGHEKIADLKKRIAVILSADAVDIRLHEYLTEAQKAQRELERKQAIAPPNLDKKTKKKDDVKKLEAAKQKQEEEQQKLIASGLLDDNKSVDQCGLEADRIVFYVLKGKDGVWEEIDVEKLQPAVGSGSSGGATKSNAAGARPLSSPMAPSQTPSASALAQFQTSSVAAQFGSSLNPPGPAPGK